MLQKTRAIVLHTLRHTDAAVVVHAYTEVAGRAAFLVYVSRSKRSKVRPAVLQPLALVELEADLRATTTLQRVKEARVVHPLTSLPYDPRKAAVAMYLAEFLYRVLQEQTANKALFDYLWQSVAYLDACRQGVANFHLAMLLRLSLLLGLYPNLEGCTPSTCFDLMAGCYTPQPPSRHVYYLQPAEAVRIPVLMRMNYRNMHLFKMNREQRQRCLAVIQDYYRLHLPGLPELRSAEVLKALFDN